MSGMEAALPWQPQPFLPPIQTAVQRTGQGGDEGRRLRLVHPLARGKGDFCGCFHSCGSRVLCCRPRF